MWEPITTSNNYSAYTPERPTHNKDNTFSQSMRQKSNEKRTPRAATQAEQNKKTAKPEKKKMPSAKKIADKYKSKQSDKKKAQATEERPISDGRVQENKPKKKQKQSQQMLVAVQKSLQKKALRVIKILKICLKKNSKKP